VDQADAVRVPAAQVSAAALDAAVAANNAFALNLYSEVDSDAGASNLLTSPLSASLALVMAYAGAVGPTATQMATALHFDADGGTSIFDGQNALSQALASRGPTAIANEQQDETDASADNYQLEVVNSVWGEETYPWAAPFLSILATSYGTGVHLQDFVNQWVQATGTINAWVSSETDDKINDLLPVGALSSLTRMVLVNALHLKFPWSSVFDSTATATGSFVRADGLTVSPSFMNQTESVPYVDDGQAQIAGLPLAGQLSVVIAVPHPGVALATYEAGLAVSAPPLVLPASYALVAISVPKVTFTSPTFSLATALKAMGMTQAFDPVQADFSGMCPHTPDGLNLYVSDVLQKATVSMQETGVEAAAATAVVVAGADGVASQPPQPIPMVVNRPYLMAIVDVPTGAILFLGHIEDPTQSGGP
jgi:serpin B